MLFRSRVCMKCKGCVTVVVCVSSRTPWKRCCFSGDGEYIVAGSARQHALYIWEKSIGNLVKILHGTRGELLLDVAVGTLSSPHLLLSSPPHLSSTLLSSPLLLPSSHLRFTSPLLLSPPPTPPILISIIWYTSLN